MLTRLLFASLPALFSVTLFLNAGLLFLVEPMIAKMILPRLGGTPAVWNLAPMLAELAYENNLSGRICDDEEDTAIEKYGSTWVLLARTERDLGGIAGSKSWHNLTRRKNVRVWTDDFSNILSVFKW